MLINCDIGERGARHNVDDELMSLIDIANIACGGHAGDAESIKHYQDLAKKHGVKISAHLSYPDKENFGREKLQISREELMASLDEQIEAFGEVEVVKLHGALYNHANRSPELAEDLAVWFKKVGVKEVLTPHRSMLHKACNAHSIAVLYEAFADRAYTNMTVGLELMPRDQLGAVLENIDDIVRQVRRLKNGTIQINGQNFLIEADTVCIHSDSPQALEAVKAISKIL